MLASLYDTYRTDDAMRYLEARFDLPGDPPSLDAGVHPADRRDPSWGVVGWHLRREAAVEYALFYFEGEISPYRRAIEGVDSIAWYDLTPVSETSFYAYVCQETRAADERWRAAFARRDLVVVPPITYDAASVMGCAIVGGAADLRALLEGLSAAIDMTVERLGEYDHRYGTITEGVTDRQLAALGTAVEFGYYDTPRTATLREVAAAAGYAPSTTSNHLRKTE